MRPAIHPPDLKAPPNNQSVHYSPSIGFTRYTVVFLSRAHTHTRTHVHIFNLQVSYIVDKPPVKNSAKGKCIPPAPQAEASKPHGAQPAPAPRQRLRVQNSKVHGKGVFATRPIARGERVIEYKGEIISAREAENRHPHDPLHPNHTFFFQREDGKVIDGGVHGNSARWINHACTPNCETHEENGRIFIHALRPIEPGEEITYDYGLVLDMRYTQKVKAEYACLCGSPKCRGTLLAPKGRSKTN